MLYLVPRDQNTPCLLLILKKHSLLDKRHRKSILKTELQVRAGTYRRQYILSICQCFESPVASRLRDVVPHPMCLKRSFLSVLCFLCLTGSRKDYQIKDFRWSRPGFEPPTIQSPSRRPIYWVTGRLGSAVEW